MRWIGFGDLFVDRPSITITYLELYGENSIDAAENRLVLIFNETLTWFLGELSTGDFVFISKTI